MCLSSVLAAFLFLRKAYKEHSLVATLCLVSLMALVLYRKFLFGNVSYLYTTVDGFSQYLPTYTNIVGNLRESGSLPWWTFTIGFGHVQSYDVLLYPLNAIPCLAGVLFGNHALELSFAWMQVVKIILAALFMYLFLKELNFSRFPCSVAAILYAFCGIIILRGNWVYLADECYLAMFILWSTELYFKKKQWYWIPIAVFTLGTCLGMYYLYLYALLLAVYSTVRFLYAGCPARKYPAFIIKCGGLYVIGILMWSVILIGFGWLLFATERYSATEGYMRASEILKIVDPHVLFTAFARLFSTDSIGIFDRYTGVLNFLEGPLFYCGLCCLFMVPQAFFGAKKRQKWLIVFGLAAAFGYILFPFVTDVLNAFIRNEELSLRSYRLSSLWICILLVALCAYGLDIGIKAGKFNQKVLIYSGITIISAFVFMCVISYSTSYKIELGVSLQIFIFLISWLIAFAIFNGGKRSLILVMCLVVVEAGLFSYTTIRGSYNVAMQNYQNMQKDDAGYYGSYAAAVAYIKNLDDGLYRMGGTDSVVGVANFCAPQYFGTFDSSYYTDIDSATYSFLKTVYPESFVNGIGSKYSIGVGDNLFLSTLTGYKYLILKSGSTEGRLYGYDYLAAVGNMEVYRNSTPLSIGFTYDKYISKSDFMALSENERQIVMLRCAVLDDGADSGLQTITQSELEVILNAANNNMNNMNWYKELIEDRSRELLKMTSWKEDQIEGTVSCSSKRILFFSIPDVSGWTVWVDGVKTEIQTVNIGFFGIQLSKGQHTIELRYLSGTLLPGLTLSVVSITLFICMICLRRKLRWLESNVSLSFNEEKSQAVIAQSNVDNKTIDGK